MRLPTRGVGGAPAQRSSRSRHANQHANQAQGSHRCEGLCA